MIRKPTKSEIGFEKIGLNILLIALVGWLIGEIVTWNYYRFYHSNYYSFVLGSITWLVFTLYAQRIIDLNIFKKFGLIAVGVFLVSLLKQYFTVIDISSLFISSIPLIYISLYRLLILIFFPQYPNVKKIPIVIMPAKYSVYWRGQEKNYSPTWREKLFSFLLHFGTVAIMFSGVIIIAKNHL